MPDGEREAASASVMPHLLSGLRLDELLREVQERLAEIVATRDRMQGLLDAVLAVAEGLELDTTLRRIVGSAVDLVDARYGAPGVLARAAASRGSSTWAWTTRRCPGWARCPRARACSAS
ncbi:MAG: hypothetical protein QOF00_5339 [Pseudonocardiales bacterium]|jgi:hypothetical protein|nr:hypothetical protein [Pseudonocardiales bacterium]